jgi:steroid delta-isomerase-like uncharacterized protein
MTEPALERLSAIAHRWIDEGWHKGNADIIDELHAAHFVDRAAAGRTPDRVGFKEGIVELYAAFPDFHAVIEDLVIDTTAGKVAVRWSATGTHRGVCLGILPTGRRISFRGIEIIRIENERIVERWGEWDGIDLLQQLGRLTG